MAEKKTGQQGRKGGDDDKLPEAMQYVGDQLRPPAESMADKAAEIADNTGRVAHAAERAVGPADGEFDETDPFPALRTTERRVTLRRSELEDDTHVPFWMAIARHTEAISFPRYAAFINRLLCPDNPDAGDVGPAANFRQELRRLSESCRVPGVDAYELLRQATETFLLLHCGICIDDDGVALDVPPEEYPDTDKPPALAGTDAPTINRLRLRLENLLGPPRSTYLDTILRNAIVPGGDGLDGRCVVSASRFDAPCLLELIWSYWMEEGMLTQTVAAITRRFQNVRRSGPGPDPLQEMEMDPLRPLNGFIWGYLQDEPNRLSLARRVYEYNHHYGLSLYGRAVPPLRPADPRAKFLEAFHNLLREAMEFYKQDNDTTVIADAFAVLNSLKEAHLILSEGAHNQFRDLPWAARAEMLLQQWLLSRPELREFLRGRYMVAYPESWMGAVDAMKRLQGWSDASVVHFRDLARYGERLLLSVRYTDWGSIGNQASATAWLRYWREEIQGYIHAYHAVTGVNLTDDQVRVSRRREIYLQPSVHLRRRLREGRRQRREPSR